MHSCSRPPNIERARALLGTIVAVRVRGITGRAAHRAIDRAFAAIAEIHRLMSFHESASDISRLNRDAAAAPVAVHPHTFRVLSWAARMARLSEGLFDASVGSMLVERGVLPIPAGARPARDASFRDIKLGRSREVFFERPLWVDVGGIAKGYAVDCAIAALRSCGVTSACVNAGGDLRTIGGEGERVMIRTAAACVDAVPVMQIRGVALATSCGASFSPARRVKARADDDARRLRDGQTTVSVLAGRCVIADALTKVVLADPAAAAALLRRFRAAAHVHHPDHPGSGWCSVGTPA